MLISPLAVIEYAASVAVSVLLIGFAVIIVRFTYFAVMGIANVNTPPITEAPDATPKP